MLRPARPNSDEFVAELAELAPEACAVVAYGALLRDGLLAVPAHGWINLHFSLLPAWRGAAPVQAAIAAGDAVTGATTFQIEPALDSGPVYGVVTETIQPTDTAADLLDRLSVSGAALLETTLDGIADGRLSPVPQPPDGVTVAPKVTVDDARVRWDLPAHVVERRIRAVTPNPGAWTLVGDVRIKLGPVTVDASGPACRRARSGWTAAASGSGRPRNPCCSGTVQPPGKKQMDAADVGARCPARRVRAGLMTKPRRPRRKPLDPARRAAFDVLRAVSERDAYANLVLPALLRDRGITGRDAAFATELAYGACRTRGLLDAVIAEAAGRPPDRINPVLLDLLRLGTYQLLRTRVDAHAAVSTTVEQAGIEFDSARAGFVNGVLRTIAGREPQSWIDELAPSADSDPVGHMAFVHAHPRWIAQAFADALGARAGELDALLTADDDRPLVHLAARPGVLTAEELAQAVDGTVGRYSPYAVYLSGGDPGRLDAVRDGVGARPGRRQPAGGQGADARAGRRRRRPLAGPVRGSRRQDRAAGGDRRAVGRARHRDRAE